MPLGKLWLELEPNMAIVLNAAWQGGVVQALLEAGAEGQAPQATVVMMMMMMMMMDADADGC